MTFEYWLLVGVGVAYFVWGLLHLRPWTRRMFLNRAGLPDADLEAYWIQAQRQVAAGLPAAELAHFGDPAPWPGALKVRPRAIVVERVSDIPFAELVKLVEPKNTTGDPTGMFVDGNRFLGGLTTYPLFGPPARVRYAASRPEVLVHEFTHVLLRQRRWLVRALFF